ncbi:MAG: hypothetical protein EXX96DRAFT_552289 [Benjaminiella poitrasii]|nr:MAG: hypothetical protein EXX96DRAFT_552289 [Benjaminiella poitrasii]
MPYDNTDTISGTSVIRTWRERFFTFYTWCKIISISLNIIFMARAIEYVYSSSSFITTHHRFPGTSFLLIQYTLQVVMGSLMLLTLPADFFVMTTSKLAVADWYWKPGVLFFTLTCGNSLFTMGVTIISNDMVLGSCLDRLAQRDTPFILVTEICSLTNRLDHIFTMAVVIRDFLMSVRCIQHTFLLWFNGIHSISIIIIGIICHSKLLPHESINSFIKKKRFTRYCNTSYDE